MRTVNVDTEQLREELIALLEGRYGHEHAVRQKVRIMRRSQVVALMRGEAESGPMIRGWYPNAPLYYLDFGAGMTMDRLQGPVPIYVWRLVLDASVTAMPHEDKMLDEEYAHYEEFARLDRQLGDPYP